MRNVNRKNHDQRRGNDFFIGWARIRDRDAEGVEGEGNGEGVSPSPAD